MRINRFVALVSGVSRRAADIAVAAGRVQVNDRPAVMGETITKNDTVTFDGQQLTLPTKTTTIILDKPPGYVCSRNGQGSKTIYDLLPPELCNLKPIGRLDKDSSGLLLLTDDGTLAYELTHPKFEKEKIYDVELDKPLVSTDKIKIAQGVQIDDYTSRLRLSQPENSKQTTDNRSWRVAMSMGRNRQIRRTFATLGYQVTKLHRIQFGGYTLQQLKPGSYSRVSV